MPTPNSAPKINLDLHPGAILLAHQFLPKYKLSVSDVCPVLGMSRDGLYKRIRNKNISLKISKDELGRTFILLTDLIVYLFPESPSPTAMPSKISQLPIKKRKRGRPRKGAGI